jgi:hypothetical protein
MNLKIYIYISSAYVDQSLDVAVPESKKSGTKFINW